MQWRSRYGAWFQKQHNISLLERTFSFKLHPNPSKAGPSKARQVFTVKNDYKCSRVCKTSEHFLLLAIPIIQYTICVHMRTLYMSIMNHSITVNNLCSHFASFTSYLHLCIHWSNHQHEHKEASIFGEPVKDQSYCSCSQLVG